MDFYTLSDKAIAEILGQRLKTLRLRKNITQATLAKSSTLSINTIKSLEKGQGKLASLIAILRELNSLSQLNPFIAEVPISPLQMAHEQGLLKRNKSYRKTSPIKMRSRAQASHKTNPIPQKSKKLASSNIKKQKRQK